MKLFTSLKCNILFFTIALLFPVVLFSQTNRYTGASGGNWNTNGNWSLGVVPTAAHDVLVNTNVSINVNTSPTINSLTISGNATVSFTVTSTQTISIDNNGSSIVVGSSLTLVGISGGGTRQMRIAFTGAGRTMAIAGTLNINIAVNDPGIYIATNSATTVTGTINNNGGTITSTAANLSFSPAATYNHQTNGNAIAIATWAATANCNITGITGTSPTIVSLTQAFGNLTWDCPGETTGFILAGIITTIQGTFTVGNVGGYGLFLASTNNSTYTLNIGGDLIINNANGWLSLIYGTNDGTASSGDNIIGTINVGGNFTQSAGAFDFYPYIATDANLSLNKLQMNVTGNFSKSGGFFDFCAGNSDTPNYTELNLTGNLSFTSGVMQRTSGDPDITNGRITFNKSGTQTVFAATPTNLAYTNYVVASTSTTQLLSNIVLQEFTTASFADNFTVNGILDAGTNQILSSTGAAAGTNNSFTLNSGAGLITANTNGVQNANIGTVSTSLATRTYNSGANFTYNNSSSIQNSGIFTTTTPNLINNLTINNTAGAGTTGVTLQQPIAVAGVLTLTSGHITTTSNLLTMNAGSSVNGANYAARTSGGSANSFINGPLRKVGGTDFLFPVGKLTRGIRFCGVSGTGTATDSFTGEFISGSASNMAGGITASGLIRVSKCEYWTIATTAGSPDVSVTLSWNPASICNAAAYVTQLSSLVVAHYGSSWDDFGGSADAGSNVSSGSITWDNVTTFSPFSLGSTSASENPLPVKLVNVKAYHTGDRNRIEWTNLTEIDVVAYEVERSLNGTQFIAMASLAARSNANDKESYFEYDVQPASVTYYRIKVTSRDGEIVYSPIVKVATNLTVKQDIVLYPNPVTGKQFTMQMNSAAGDYYVKIFSTNGQIVKTETLKHPGGAYAKTIELPAQLQAGQYYMQVSGGEKILTSKFIVQ